MWRFIILIFVFKSSESANEINKLYNLMLISEATNTNMASYWSVGYSDNDPNGDKHLSAVSDSIPKGNFRSALIDDWFLEPPHEVAILFFNRMGDLHSWMVFNTANTASEELTLWITPEKLLATSLTSMSLDKILMHWNISGFQFVISTKQEPNKAWFAVSDRNLRNNSNLNPYFVIPLDSSKQFVILGDGATAGAYQTALIHTFGPFSSVTMVELDIVNVLGPNPVYVSEMEVKDLVSTLDKENMTVQYSSDECSVQNQRSYRNLLDNSLAVFKTNTKYQVETLSIKCLWITFYKPMALITVNLYEPNPTDDFLTLPVVVFRGFWFKDYTGSGTSLAVNYLLSNINYTSKVITTESTTSLVTTTESTTSLVTTTESTTSLETTTKLTTSSAATTFQNQASESIISTDVYTKLHSGTTTTVSSNTQSMLPDTTQQDFLGQTTTILKSGSTKISTADPICICECLLISGMGEDLETRLKNLKIALAVNKTQLSSYRRKHISVSDNRRSASYLGYFAGIILSLSIIAVVALDITSLRRISSSYAE